MKAAIALLILLCGCVLWPGCGAAVLATCSDHEHAIVALPCGELDVEACRARDAALLTAERQRCDAEMAGVP